MAWPDNIVIRILPVVVLVASGCTHQLDVSYAVDPSRQSPLRTISSLIVILEVEDIRPRDESDVVGVHAPLGYDSVRYQTKKEVQAILLEGLRNEFENNGHKVIPVAGGDADVKIVARVKKFWFDQRTHLFSSDHIGTISADLEILHPKDRSIYGKKLIIGTFRDNMHLFNPVTVDSVMNSALAEFIRSFSRDPEILEYLRLAQEEKKGK